MEETVLFKVLDALDATPDQIRRYLKRITGQTELNVVYSENGKYKTTRDVADKECSLLVGLQVANIVVFNQRISFADFNSDGISVADIRNQVKKIHPKAKPINKSHLSLLLGCEDKYRETVDRLNVCGFDIQQLPEYFILIEDNMPDSTTKLPGCDISGLNKLYSYISSFIKDHTILVCCDVKDL